MGQIVRRKKKGRPSKADLARRSGESPATAQPDLRRSRRRRNVRYNIDYDDYLDEDEEDEEEEDERRREKKKLKLVVKLNQGGDDDDEEEEDESAPSRTRVGSRVNHARELEGEDKHLKKRKLRGNEDREREEEAEEGEEEEEGEGNEGREENEDEDEGRHESGVVSAVKMNAMLKNQ